MHRKILNKHPIEGIGASWLCLVRSLNITSTQFCYLPCSQSRHSVNHIHYVVSTYYFPVPSQRFDLDPHLLQRATSLYTFLPLAGVSARIGVALPLGIGPWPRPGLQNIANLSAKMRHSSYLHTSQDFIMNSATNLCATFIMVLLFYIIFLSNVYMSVDNKQKL